jgi:amino acid transporter
LHTEPFGSLFTAGTLTGFDASGHIAEETKNARYDIYNHVEPVTNDGNSVTAARGILTSAIATGILGFITAILFLFCTPDLDTVFALDAPQPFVQIYALALGRGGSIFMTIIAVIGLIMVRSILWLLKQATSNVQGWHRTLPLLSLLLLDLYSPWLVTVYSLFPAGSVE